VLPARLATAAIAIPFLLGLIFWAPPWGMTVFVTVLAVLALAEYSGLAFSAQPRDRALSFGVGSAVVLAAAYGPGPWLTAALAAFLLAGLSWTVLVRSDFERGLSDLGLTAIGVLYVGILLPHFIWLHRLDGGPGWVAFVIAVGMAGDTAGYFVGRGLGRHRLIPRVSPGKTVEGAVGVLLGSVLGGVLANLLFLHARPWPEIVLLAMVMGVIGQLGDLSESVMKRSFGAKESGWIFPGHGGVLDRIDSLLFPVALVYYYWLGVV
jgi:phosphatidate cytidylyltransferase